VDEAGSTYDDIGETYTQTRRAEPAWMTAIETALGSAGHIVNVGAGTGSYEPSDRAVVAVEPSTVMLRQRQDATADVVRGRAEALPFTDQAFDAALATLTLHHWSDPARGLSELRRVAPRQVVLTWDPRVTAHSFWLVSDYLPEVAQHDRYLATLDDAVAGLGSDAYVVTLPVPANCADGVLAAYWQRPTAYLDAGVRAGMSGLALLEQNVVNEAINRLQQDLTTGLWQRRYGHLTSLTEIDLGYRLVVAGPGN
jgi:SAM-dependent methyltransferase